MNPLHVTEEMNEYMYHKAPSFLSQQVLDELSYTLFRNFMPTFGSRGSSRNFDANISVANTYELHFHVQLYYYD